MPVPPQPANPIIRQHQVVLDQINLLLTHLCTLARDAQKHEASGWEASATEKEKFWRGTEQTNFRVALYFR